MKNFILAIAITLLLAISPNELMASSDGSLLSSMVESQFLLSAILVLLGSMAIFISAFVSGHNIYKDLSSHFSTLITSTLGIILFIFSPISHIIYIPENFISYSEGAFQGNTLVTLVKEAIIPYIFLSIGIGLVFGSLHVVKFRSCFMRWIKRKTGLNHLTCSYGYAWDDFLFSVKPGGLIRVQLSDKKLIEGQLRSFSIKEEPREIELGNFTEITTNNEQRTMRCQRKSKSNILISGEKLIEKIIVEPKSFNKHSDLINHSSHSLYFLITSIGFLISGIAMEKSILFVSEREFSNIYNIYTWPERFFLFFSIVFIVSAYYVLRQDYKNIRSIIVLCPPVSILFILLLFFIAKFLIEFLYRINNIQLPLDFSVTASVFLVFLVSLLTFYSSIKNRRIFKMIEETLQDKNIEAKCIKCMVDELYLEIDPNKVDYESFEKLASDYLKDKGNPWKCKNAIQSLSIKFNMFLNEKINIMSLQVFPNSFLKGEEIKILHKFKRYFESNKYKRGQIIVD